MAELEIFELLQWLVMAAMALCIFALARQIGLLHERMPGVGALVTSEGPDLGDIAPRTTLISSAGAVMELGVPRLAARPLLLMFVSPTCPVCKTILPWLTAFARDEDVELALLSETGKPEVEAQFRTLVGPTVPFVGNAASVALSFRVGKLPYAVLIDREGRVAAKGLINSREHLESLIVSTELGAPTLQAHLGLSQGHSHAH